MANVNAVIYKVFNIFFSESAAKFTSERVLNGEKLNRTVPSSIVPTVSCAVGEQCRPARTHIPTFPNLSASSSLPILLLIIDSTPDCADKLSSKKSFSPGVPPILSAKAVQRFFSCLKRASFGFDVMNLTP